MPLTAAASLLDLLRSLQLLRPAQLDEIEKAGLARYAEARSLAQHMVQRGWLTPFQIGCLLQDRAADLILGPYLLLDRLGEGVSGTVYKARHQRMNRVVALRVVRQELLAHPQAVGRFYQEVEAASKLSHDNVVHAYDAGPMGPTHVLAMEYVPGIDLEQLVQQRGPVPLARACDYIYQAALGLQHAVEYGLTHRGLKPSKLIVTVPVPPEPNPKSTVSAKESGTLDRADVVKITDIGLTRLQSCARSSVKSTEGVYLAPEQLAPGMPVDTRADVYALGCIFCYVLTGQPPTAGTGQAVLPPLAAEVPADVAAVIQRMTAVAPADRFQTPGEAAEALQGFVSCDREDPSTHLDFLGATELGPAGSSKTLARRQGATRANSRSWREDYRWVVVVGVVGALLLAGIAVWQFAPQFLAGAGLPRTGPEPKNYALAELNELKARAKSPLPDGSALWLDVARFRGSYPGTLEAREAIEVQLRLTSPLDRLDPSAVSPEDRVQAGQLKELTAVLGEQRWRTWSPLVRSVAFHPQGKLAASTSGHDVLLWDVPSGTVKTVLKGHSAPVTSVAFSSKGQLASTSNDKHVRVWDVVAGKELLDLVLGGEVLSAAFAPDGNTLVTGNKGGGIHIWNLPTGKKETNRVVNTKVAVQALAVSKDGKFLAAGFQDGKLRMWKLDGDEEPAIKFPEHSGGVTAVAFVPESDLILTGGNDQHWRLINVPTGKEIRKTKHGGQVVGVAVSPNGQLLASAGKDGTVKLYDVATGQGRGILNDPDGLALTDVAFSPNGQSLLVGTQGNVVRLWSLAPVQALTPTRQSHVQPCTAVRFGPDGATLVSGGNDGVVRIWDGVTARQRLALKGHGGPILGVTVAADGRQAASGSADRTVKLWDLTAGKELAAFPGLNTPIHTVQFSPDGQFLAGGGDDAIIHSWDLSTRTARSLFVGPAHTRPLRGLACSPDGKQLASAGLDKLVKLWSMNAGTEQLAVTGTAWHDFTCVAFAPDGQMFAAGGDRSVRLWETATGKEVSKLTGLSAPIAAIAFSPDGQLLAAVTVDGQISVWKPAAGTRVRIWQLPGGASAVDFAPDGRHLAVANGNGSMYIFRLAAAGTTVK